MGSFGSSGARLGAGSGAFIGYVVQVGPFGSTGALLEVGVGNLYRPWGNRTIELHRAGSGAGVGQLIEPMKVTNFVWKNFIYYHSDPYAKQYIN